MRLDTFSLRKRTVVLHNESASGVPTMQPGNMQHVHSKITSNLFIESDYNYVLCAVYGVFSIKVSLNKKRNVLWSNSDLAIITLFLTMWQFYICFSLLKLYILRLRIHFNRKTLKIHQISHVSNYFFMEVMVKHSQRGCFMENRIFPACTWYKRPR